MAITDISNKPYIIPSRPKVLIKIIKLLDAKEIDIDKVVSVLRKDVSLYSAVLATANTAAFNGGNKISSIGQAVMRIGFSKMLTILRLLALKNSLSKVGNLERFWDSSTEIAELTMSITKKVSNENIEEAYSLGMMHNCGIPMLMEAISGYRNFLTTIDTNNIVSWINMEKEVFNVNHLQVGAEISRRWLMPQIVTDTIMLQSKSIKELEIGKNTNEHTKLLLCSLFLAKEISNTYRRYWRIRAAQPVKGIQKLLPALSFIGISETDYLEIRDVYLDRLECIV